MRPKRRPNGPQQLQPQPFQSDYDTEDPNTMTDAPAILPTFAPPDRTNTELNLAVLRRYCSEITHIVTIAPFSVVYIFSPESQAWEKCGIEGTLFVNKLTTPDGAPRYNIMILNRKSMDNFMTDLTSADDIDITDEYVILQAKGGEEQTLQIYGLWIFSEIAEQGMSTRELVGTAVQSCAAQVQAYHEISRSNTRLASTISEFDGAGQKTDIHDDPPRAAQHTTGSPLNLLQLFGNAAPHSSIQMQPTQQTYNHTYPANLPSTANLGHSSGVTLAGPARQAPHQKNVLLDLFKSAR